MANTVKLYYYNVSKDKNLLLLTEAIIPIIRAVENKDNLIKETIELLVDGLITEEEKLQGFSTEFPHPDFKLLDYELQNGTLTLTFTEVPGFTSGGSSRVILLASQIEKTALQFEEIKEVIFKPETLFQP